MPCRCRVARPSDLKELAGIWNDGWNEAHRLLLPPEVSAARTPESFVRRLEPGLKDVRVIEDEVGLAGFHYIKGSELYQFYVPARARGRGMAQKLMVDAEHSFVNRGVIAAWLACAIGNNRAAGFYKKAGWVLTGTFDYSLSLPGGTFNLRAWRFERSLCCGHRRLEHRE